MKTATKLEIYKLLNRAWRYCYLLVPNFQELGLILIAAFFLKGQYPFVPHYIHYRESLTVLWSVSVFIRFVKLSIINHTAELTNNTVKGMDEDYLKYTQPAGETLERGAGVC